MSFEKLMESHLVGVIAEMLVENEAAKKIGNMYKHVGKTKTGFDVKQHADGHQIHVKNHGDGKVEWHHLEKHGNGMKELKIHSGHGPHNLLGHLKKFHNINEGKTNLNKFKSNKFTVAVDSGNAARAAARATIGQVPGKKVITSKKDKPVKHKTNWMNEAEETPEHPLHQHAIDGGLKHTRTTKLKDGKVTLHTYMPDHHWKSGVTLRTDKVGKKEKHSWETGVHNVKGDDADSLKAHIKAGNDHYDWLMNHHKNGTGPFKS